MAVYTPLTREDIEALLARYALGELTDFAPIAEGVENTNYLVRVGAGPYILTLFEARTKAEDLPYFIALIEWWVSHGVRCPRALRDKHGAALQCVKGKPALVVSFIEGGGVECPQLQHFAPLGEVLARLHAVEDFSAAHPAVSLRQNALSLAGWRELLDKIKPDAVRIGLDGEALEQEFSFLEMHWPQGLPVGEIHADLFPDNVFFQGEKLTGIIDPYFACHDFYAYDLAITINAWCFTSGEYQPAFTRALMEAYQLVRPLSTEELAAMPVLLRGASLRFLLTRAYDKIHTPPDALVTAKDPQEYVRKLKFFQGNPWQ